MKIKKRQNGFTLIELLVVVAILGVIGVFAIPNIIGFLDKGAGEAAKAEQHNLVVAVSAALYDAEIDSSVDFVFDTTARIWDPDASGVAKGDPAFYLDKATKYQWAISATGNVTPGTKAGGNPIGS